jgi:ferric-dicitrate binding protein FerR (iron transport regulator)
MKEMNNRERFTDKEWEELASVLSGEKGENNELLSRFMAEDFTKTGEMWKMMGGSATDDSIDIDKAWSNVQSRVEAESSKTTLQVSPVRSLRYTFVRIAAAGLILLGLGSAALYMNYSGSFSKKITVTTGMDQKNFVVALSDGSKITMNRNSEFSYRENFGKHTRKVNLKGEAFFEIAPDAGNPFIIDAGKASVKVVGTSFNVITENSESTVEVYVKTGKVLLSDLSGSNSIILEPEYVGKVFSGISDKYLNSNPNYMAWKTEHLVYTGQKLDVVFKDLKRVYNMDIVADDSSILENPWSSPIDSGTQETFILIICRSFNLSYIKVGDVYHLTKK